MLNPRKSVMVTPEDALEGRSAPIAEMPVHHVSGRSLVPPYPDGMERMLVGMGCFWGAERLFWQHEGVWVTAVGYAGGYTPNPTYEEVCSGGTGHTEVVLVVFDPKAVAYEALLRRFWENHDPTQGMRQGNDRGTQYRSAVYTDSDAQLQVARDSMRSYQERLRAAGHGAITTEIRSAPELYFAEPYHQQYLSKNPNGYCGIGGTGVGCPIGVGA